MLRILNPTLLPVDCKTGSLWIGQVVGEIVLVWMSGLVE